MAILSLAIIRRRILYKIFKRTQEELSEGISCRRCRGIHEEVHSWIITNIFGLMCGNILQYSLQLIMNGRFICPLLDSGGTIKNIELRNTKPDTLCFENVRSWRTF